MSTQASQSDGSGRREEGNGDAGEPMVAEATEEHSKPTRAISSEDEVARLTIEVKFDHPPAGFYFMPPSLSPQTMSVDDFATMLAYLVRVCWSAAAGQLHLASISESHPPSPAQPPSRGQQETTPPEGGGPATQLQAGLCLRQEAGSVSSKVRYLVHSLNTHTLTSLLRPSECSHSS